MTHTSTTDKASKLGKRYPDEETFFDQSLKKGKSSSSVFRAGNTLIKQLTFNDLTSEHMEKLLTPIEIGYRLWSAYKLMESVENKRYPSSDTSTSTTVYDGTGYLITATRSDSITFAVVYAYNGSVLGLMRLNRQIYAAERGKMSFGEHVESVPAHRGMVVSIDITHVDKILQTLKIELSQVGKIQVGCADSAATQEEQTKKFDDDYLLRKFREISQPGLSDVILTESLTRATIADCCSENSSIAIQTLAQNSPMLIGVYDGYTHVRNPIPDIFIEHCKMSCEQYKTQAMSVYKNNFNYMQDNAESHISAFKPGRNIALSNASLFTLRTRAKEVNMSIHGCSNTLGL